MKLPHHVPGNTEGPAKPKIAAAMTRKIMTTKDRGTAGSFAHSSSRLGLLRISARATGITTTPATVIVAKMATAAPRFIVAQRLIEPRARRRSSLALYLSRVRPGEVLGVDLLGRRRQSRYYLIGL